MAEIKFTKNELRLQQNRLTQLQKYLPTLQLKKAMLQIEVSLARQEILELEKHYHHLYATLEGSSSLLSDEKTFNAGAAAKVETVDKIYENIAGVEVPCFKSISFAEFSYSLFDTPPWVDSIVQQLRKTSTIFAKIAIAHEKKAALEYELRDVSIRVNLFEKVLIPRALRNIKKIKVFLGDQQLAAVSQAKVAKNKIEDLKLSAIALADLTQKAGTCAST